MGARVTPEQALELLLEGNRRWVEGRSAHPNSSPGRRGEVATGQQPFATVFSCLDSRVPPEMVFDRGAGDLAVIRTGGHVLDAAVVLGSLQFCAQELRTPLMLVMGHQSCGAVAAAIEVIEERQSATAALQSIVEALEPAYRAARFEAAEAAGEGAAELPERMARAHTALTVQAMAKAEGIAPLIRSGALEVLGAHYSLDTGRVAILE